MAHSIHLLLSAVCVCVCMQYILRFNHHDPPTHTVITFSVEILARL